MTPLRRHGNISLALNTARCDARVVELADSLDSGSSVLTDVRVQVPPRAPNHDNPNLVPVGDGFGLLLYL
ncbi:hypothetical protein KL86CLO1_10827 [uncultured Eubacteriales bacterium]|uniref:Uncharacterized protein n=1 Tax=uncultured Eubacteriales bacterium TaxID=172733 RepID=A0A212JBK1_9FIRM|nr:hypothetical protein KL86CLO1_10827 [uncultured Eubacteriales bacterium]